MDGNREKQIKESHIIQSADKKPGIGPLHLVIMPTALKVGQERKTMKDSGINELIMSYSSLPTATQTRAKPVRLVMRPAASTADQQLPCTSTTKQSERKVLLLPHSIIKQRKNVFSQSVLTNKLKKNIQALSLIKGHRQTGCNTVGAEYHNSTHEDTGDSRSALQATSPKDDRLCTVVSSVGGTDVEALQESRLVHKVKTVLSGSPAQAALLSKEAEDTHITGIENVLEIKQSSHSYVSQTGEATTNFSGTSLSSEVQPCENISTSKVSRLQEEYVSDRPDSRPGMVPPHLIVMTASPKEIDYRIKAFLARKRAELDVQNVEEYCRHIGMNPNVCARIDATVHQHRKRKKRKFEFAPQPEEQEEGTQFMSKYASQEQLPLSVAHPILEERVANIEEHIRLGKPVPKDIYSRLKRIEDRILRLEGISPEYAYDAAVNLHPPRTLPKIKRRCTVGELDAKIAELQKKFEKKPAASSQKEILK